jgi:hypothetical protein
MAKTTFDFKNTEAAKEVSFLKPGVYAMKVTEVKLDKFPKGSPYLGITFETADGLKLTEKMGYSSDKALEVFVSRLQYLHEAWTKKKLDKVLTSAEDVEAYFKKTFVNPKAGTRLIIVGGEVSGKNTYATLPFTGFIVGDDSKLTEGEFEEGSEEWKKYVKASNRKSEATGKKNGVLNEDDDDATDDAAEDDTAGEEDTPW